MPKAKFLTRERRVPNDRLWAFLAVTRGISQESAVPLPPAPVKPRRLAHEAKRPIVLGLFLSATIIAHDRSPRESARHSPGPRENRFKAPSEPPFLLV
jgi:hypothetical protein